MNPMNEVLDAICVHLGNYNEGALTQDLVKTETEFPLFLLLLLKRAANNVEFEIKFLKVRASQRIYVSCIAFTKGATFKA